MTYQDIQNLMWAAEMVQLRARTVVIEHLTGIAAAKVRRLVRDMGGRPIPGPMAYTTTWFEKRSERLVHCAVYLRSHTVETSAEGESLAAVFLRGFSRYTQTVKMLPEQWQEQQLDVNRAFLATRLSRMGELTRRSCTRCTCRFVEVRGDIAKTCQICRNRVSNVPAEERERWLGSDVVPHDGKCESRQDRSSLG